MPTGPGLRWDLDGTRYIKKSMKKGVSFSQIQWLLYMQETDLCLNSNGDKIQIQHAYFRGEHEVDNFKIDGYFVKDGIEYFLEYLG